MKASFFLSLAAAATAVLAALAEPLSATEGDMSPAVDARDIFGRAMSQRLCVISKGIMCHYMRFLKHPYNVEYHQCTWHKCTNCKCDKVWKTMDFQKSECTNKKETKHYKCHIDGIVNPEP